MDHIERKQRPITANRRIKATAIGHDCWGWERENEHFFSFTSINFPQLRSSTSDKKSKKSYGDALFVAEPL